ncbi:aspartate carbamoyltransferase catalytic subunit [Pajaroellobacter abortibovis]|uniref:Aspartate carbamoyltransferase n=1 Tax=Pajaroellobacter abortibovis TaxID=1882918 RepID=A0A1L6MXA9_9BACT|nr:aspartate carbamoyltransferase catalytic subunit [Pajaroellobacter abortibovis]APS00028.1 aspartate carbamoyltransferase [Pajaroellobacter abortibovis]
MWNGYHLLGIENLSEDQIQRILDTAESYCDHTIPLKDHQLKLQGKTVMALFIEASTRTRISFELAAKGLGAHFLSFNSSFSSFTKGESLLDTIKNLEALNVQMIILRHPSEGAPHFLASHTKMSIVNAGDGMHGHPTQALLDAFIIRRKKGRLDGLTVAICGDILHSRVARSDAMLLSRMGVRVRLCGPRNLLPKKADRLGPHIEIYDNLTSAIQGADVIMMLRVQAERIQDQAVLSLQDYGRAFCLTPFHLQHAKPDVIVMHPGPVQFGVELDREVIHGPHSVILEQTKAGIGVRMAVLAMVADARKEMSLLSVH